MMHKITAFWMQQSPQAAVFAGLRILEGKGQGGLK
jgi:hypothetical protein